MRLLLDTCVWGGVQTEVKDAGHNVVWSGDWAEDPGDDEILAMAARENRIVVTLDKDFGELAIVHQRPHCGIIRLVDISARQQAKYCLAVLKRHAGELQKGAIITVYRDRVRIRAPDE
jgi:predicted nuclease of predicted toxin-antitoxin system